ncbi:MAG: flavodoxin-dependent (E)-4-hydroxy-3-methylbut-2-enyl-diphosphate synthase [Lachnospirales bacterium]
MYRRKTRVVQIGDKFIGGDNPILIQSMTSTKTRDVEATVKQIKGLAEAGCEIVRVAVPTMEDALAIKEIKKQISIPLVADIHFDYKLALKSIEMGVDKLRINPGNIGSKEKVAEVVKACKEKNIPIRIGVNSGSLEKELIDKYGGVTPSGIVESAMKHVEILQELDYHNIVLSLKSSNVPFAIESYKKISELVDYPLHIGITEAGTLKKGTIKSAVGIGSILSQGIGDTIRVTLTSDPVEEIYVAKDILQSLDLRTFGINLISCPTCGRTEISLIELAKSVEKEIENLDMNITVAVMGCVVNGPGEAKEADIGIAGGKGVGLIFKKGEFFKRCEEKDLKAELVKEIYSMYEENKK